MPMANVPKGPGWFKISEQTYINNSEPLKKNTKVYKGKQYTDGEWCDIAIKLIPFDQKSLEEVKLHLKIEDHPNIILLYDADVISQGIIPHIYIAMELCSQTLKDFVEERKGVALNFELYFIFAKQIVSAVDHIHQHNVLHRDLKLENILLSSTKDNIRVADFGLSKQLLMGHSVATASFRGLGTDGYRAPELLREKPEASFRSDSFSLGIVLAMLFSNGQHPFGPDPSRWRTNIADNKGRDLSHILEFKKPYSHKRALLVDLIEQCLQYSPRTRPTPKQMLQHGFFSESQAKGSTNEMSSSKMMSDFRSVIASRNSSEKESLLCSTPIGDADPMSNDDNSTEFNEAADPIDQFLSARKKRVDRLERDLAIALRSGQGDHARILSELKKLREVDDLDIILPLAEYELVNKRNDSSVEKVHRVISEAGSRSALDVRQKGYICQVNGEYVQAMILFKIAHYLHKEEGLSSPDSEVRWISDRVIDITCAINPLLKAGGRLTSREVATTHGVRHAEDLLQELRAMEGLTPSVKAFYEVKCLVAATANANLIGEYEKCVQYGEKGVALMKQHFSEDVVIYKDYGSVLNNLGNAYGRIGQYTKAQHCYNESLDVRSKAKDYKTEEERQKDMQSTLQNMENNQSRTHGALLSQ